MSPERGCKRLAAFVSAQEWVSERLVKSDSHFFFSGQTCNAHPSGGIPMMLQNTCARNGGRIEPVRGREINRMPVRVSRQQGWQPRDNSPVRRNRNAAYHPKMVV